MTDEMCKEDRSRPIEVLYDYASSHWGQIKEMASFLRRVDLEPRLHTRVERYLPSDIKQADFAIRFVLDGGDCRGFRGVVYADLTLLSILGREKALGLLAHEFHHSCRAEIAVPYDTSLHPRLFQVLYWLETEGVADKVHDLGSEEPDNGFEPLSRLVEARRRTYADASSYLIRLDEAVKKLEDPVPIFRDNAYHPVGHFMADAIEGAFGTGELAKTVGDPFAFIEAYQASARTIQEPTAPPFSDETLRRLRQVREEMSV